MKNTDRRQFLQLMGAGALASSLSANIAKAMSIPANFKTGTLKDVEHIIILMQENIPFDKYFGTIKGVRGFADPRAVKINLPTYSEPLTSATATGTVTGSVQIPVFFQPQVNTNLAGQSFTSSFGYGIAPTVVGLPANAAWVVPPFRINPQLVGLSSYTPGATGDQTTLQFSYLPGTDHSWGGAHNHWNLSKYDSFAAVKGPFSMNHLVREDAPYHAALADAFTVGDHYFHSSMTPTSPNRYFMMTGCFGNCAPYINKDGTVASGTIKGIAFNGTDGIGSGSMVGNGISGNQHYLQWQTFPEVLQVAGITWKNYQDLAGNAFGTAADGWSGDFGGGGPTSFAGTYQDSMLLYFNQYSTSTAGSPLFDRGVGPKVSTNITGSNATVAPTGLITASGNPGAGLTTGQTVSGSTFQNWGAGLAAVQWEQWAEGLFDNFREDVENGTLPQVSWFVSPAGFSEHPAWPSSYGAWYISKIFDILVSNPAVFGKTVFIVNYDEADGSFDHIVPPAPPLPATGLMTAPGSNSYILPPGQDTGASTIPTDYEIIPTAAPQGPAGFGQRVPFLVISPWSKGGYVNSQVFDHTSTVQFIEKRFGVHSPNISPWRRAVAGDLTTCFNFANPNGPLPSVPSPQGFLPPGSELAGHGASADRNLNTTVLFEAEEAGAPAVLLGNPLPAQEKGVRPSRALPYAMEVHASVSGSAVTLQFVNTGPQTVVFHVRSGDATVLPRNYTVEPGKVLSGAWTVDLSYDLSVYGPNGFVRYFKGSVDDAAALVAVQGAIAGLDGYGRFGLRLTNLCKAGKNGRGRHSEACNVQVLDAYTGKKLPMQFGAHGQSLEHDWSLEQFYGWYDLVVTVADDPSFECRLAGHVETGRDSYSDPAMGGLVTLKA